ncbi:tetratricopeptide repeat protein [Larkinella terrae]|uniref:Tetratricopeptide repeat protein n=1 Tax=Larkinella terrae TaxID=2025311 RepID=A0A7K0EM35_9BACT|nr:tetratricopeptide repeat protein [Larkinella terrae]MRS62923.1 tetratricopeptide repeat protein [Larkinella terrae]
MKRIFSLSCLLLFLLNSAFAQKATSVVQAIRYTKLANTLRALDKPQDAINLLERALPAVRGVNPYWEAVACESLGLAYYENGDNTLADHYLKIARTRYERLRYVASAWGVNELIRDISGKNLYAGIQFGASDVKLAIFKTRYESDFYEKDIKTRIEVPNVSLVADAGKSLKAGQDALRVCLDSISRYNIPNERIFIVFSNEMKEGLAKTPATKKMLYDQLSRALPNGNLRIDTTLSLNREAELFTVGSIPRKVWPSTSSLNIGSDVTLGGYFDADKTFHPIEMPVGTNTLVNQIENKRSLSSDAFRKEAPRVVKIIADTELAYRFKSSNAGLQKRRTVGLGGDVAWALVTYLHPEKTGTTAVAISMDDVERFRKLVMEDYNALTHPNVKEIADAGIRTKAEQEIATVRDQVSEKQLIAGALWLESIMKTYSTPTAPKRFVFIRNSDIGWVTGKFLETISGEYESTIAKGALYTR